MPTTYQMTPKRRFLAGILGGRTDRPPVGSVTSVADVEQMELIGAYFPEVLLDGSKLTASDTLDWVAEIVLSEESL